MSFSLKIKNRHLYQLSNACYQIQFQKNQKNRFWEKFKNNDLGLYLPHVGHKNSIQKKDYVTFLCLLTPDFKNKNQKKSD